MQEQYLIWLVPLLPLIGFIWLAFTGAVLTKSPLPGQDTAHAHLNENGKTMVGVLATSTVFISFIIAVSLFFKVSGGTTQLLSSTYDWMVVPGASLDKSALNISFGLGVDSLTALMLLIITGVGTLIHLYSIGYMSHEAGYARFFAYLNLFIFFMLILVMASNFVLMFVGWEGVGLASYLLIGFYYEKKSAQDAAKKAFIVNRIGDAALLLGMFFIHQHFGTLNYYGENGVLEQAKIIFEKHEGALVLPTLVTNLIPLMLFIGAAGKSAQIPLYTWLPDAMEGPTPVSALIHAATMVTAGIYLLTRTHFLFLASPMTMAAVAIIGLATAFIAATIAMTQNDIKKVLAYSTVSQLGFMFLSCGVGAFGAAMFHVMTHAFFKALLFLGAGSVIHAMHGEQDMRKMGGLAKKIPTTYRTMLVGTMAISGLPFFSGFFSKDEILGNAYIGREQYGLGNFWLWAIGMGIAGMTAFYMWRMMGKTFGGDTTRSDVKVHESSPVMTIPLIILAVLSVIGGYVNLSPNHPFDHFLGESAEWANPAHDYVEKYQWVLMGISGVWAMWMSYYGYSKYKNAKDGNLLSDEDRKGSVYRTSYELWGVDNMYDTFIVAPGKRLAQALWRGGDIRMVDGILLGIRAFTLWVGKLIAGTQTGYVRNYGLMMFIGVLALLIGSLVGIKGLGGR
jgi:NADH-quinone oxidoreductase subunit L